MLSSILEILKQLAGPLGKFLNLIVSCFTPSATKIEQENKSNANKENDDLKKGGRPTWE
jgi:hypothetical protein